MREFDPTTTPEVPQAPQSLSINSADAVGDLFQTAVLLLGEEQTAALVVEQVVAGASIDPCIDYDSNANGLMNEIIAASLVRLRSDNAAALDAPRNDADGSAPGICIESDDLSASGISPADLQAMMEGPGRAKLRQWLEQLAPSLRAIFVLRAILGRDTESTATILLTSGAKGWISNRVSLIYRQALCSLATSLVNSTHSLAVS